MHSYPRTTYHATKHVYSDYCSLQAPRLSTLEPSESHGHVREQVLSIISSEMKPCSISSAPPRSVLPQHGTLRLIQRSSIVSYPERILIPFPILNVHDRRAACQELGCSTFFVFVASIVAEVFQAELKWRWLWLRGRFPRRKRFASAKLVTSSPTSVGSSARGGKGLN
jgi:hypothetical protein